MSRAPGSNAPPHGLRTSCCQHPSRGYGGRATRIGLATTDKRTTCRASAALGDTPRRLQAPSAGRAAATLGASRLQAASAGRAAAIYSSTRTLRGIRAFGPITSQHYRPKNQAVPRDRFHSEIVSPAGVFRLKKATRRIHDRCQAPVRHTAIFVFGIVGTWTRGALS